MTAKVRARQRGICRGVKRRIRYVIVYEKKVEQFVQQLEVLKEERASLQQEVHAAKRNGEKIKADVEIWCNRVDKTIDQYLKIVEVLKTKAKTKCFIGLCPNIKSRYQLSKKAEEAVMDLNELILQGRSIRPVGYRDIPEALALVDSSPTTVT
ncbi:putative Disease resistance protein RPS5 [Corchorus capsularis]|uniref:Putative Disease resistance protein RPS5 n=1 Tax=Corchorus capsularis TaxID=210143 RepID=A0A1R3HKZ0_COCAP|nr:putative Disease resistance protein RPS5 [Corchorus capsularis]